MSAFLKTIGCQWLVSYFLNLKVGKTFKLAASVFGTLLKGMTEFFSKNDS